MSLSDDLCGRYCAFYKPGKSEELSCRGFSVIERMIKGGKEIPFDLSGGRIGNDAEAGLKSVLCGRCPFCREDCDYAAGLDAPPCGGYLLIGRLLEEGTLSLDDLDEID